MSIATGLLTLSLVTTASLEPLDTIHLEQLELPQRFAVCEAIQMRFSAEQQACVSQDTPCEITLSPELCAGAGLAYDAAQCICSSPSPAPDYCEQMGWYGDGWCDDGCAQPDPDCGGAEAPSGGEDWCAQEGWYGDGYCDLDCPQPDPDCGTPQAPPEDDGDWCEQQGWYGDGICDPCPQPDPDCGG